MKISLGEYVVSTYARRKLGLLKEDYYYRITIRNDTNNTLTNAKRYAPLCYRCNGTTNNESYCFAIDDSLIGCFVETGMHFERIDFTRKTSTSRRYVY